MDWREYLIGWPMPMPTFDIVSEGTTLLVVDMQYSSVHPDYGLSRLIRMNYPEIANYYLPRVTNLVIPNIRRLLDLFRHNRLQVVYLTLGAESPDGRDMAALIKQRQDQRRAKGEATTTFTEGTLEHSVIDELRPEGDELVLNKTSYGGFNSTGLDYILRHMGIRSLVIVGVGTDICVETTARDAADRGYNCVLVEDACATFDLVSHEATLRTFAKVFGMVKSTDEVVSELSARLRQVSPASGLAK